MNIEVSTPHTWFFFFNANKLGLVEEVEFPASWQLTRFPEQV